MDPSVPENSEAFYLERDAIGFFRKRVDGNAVVDLIKSVCSRNKELRAVRYTMFVPNLHVHERKLFATPIDISEHNRQVDRRVAPEQRT